MAAAISQATRPERIADQHGTFELKPIEQLAVIDDQVPPVVDLVHGFRIAFAGAGMFRRIDRMGARQQFEKFLVVAQAPRAVQEDKRRAIAEDRDFGLDLVLP